MPDNIPEMTQFQEMIDMVFDLDSGTLPAAYPFDLWTALTQHVPQLAEEKLVGVLPLRVPENKEGMLLPKRAKLALRLPRTKADQTAAHLAGSNIQSGALTLQLGKYKSRTIQPYPTLHAHQVTGASDEIQFMNEIKVQLNNMGIAAKLICGKRHSLVHKQQSINGYSLVIHDLKPENSLKLQYAGLGENRQFGFGIFVPYKVISGLGED